MGRLVSAFIMLLVPWRALAQLPPQLSVHWQGEASCPRSSAFETELVRLLGPTAQTIEPSTVDVRVRAREAAGYRLTLTLEVAGAESQRVVDLPDCGDIPRTAALLVATALEQSAMHEPLQAPPRALQPVDPSRVRTGARLDAGQSWALRLGALGDDGSLPGATAGPAAGAQWSLGQLRVWLEGRFLGARARADDDSRLVGEISLFAGALGVARMWQIGRFALGPLAEVELGALRARAHGELARSHASAFWGSAQLGMVIERALGYRISLALSAQASLPWSRPRFGLAGESAFYTTGHAAARLGLGIRVKLGSKKDGALGQ